MKKNRFNIVAPPFVPDEPGDVLLLGIGMESKGEDEPPIEILLAIQRGSTIEDVRVAVGLALLEYTGDAGAFSKDVEKHELRKRRAKRGRKA